MANASIVARYKSLIRKLLPRGKAFELPDGSPIQKTFDAMAEEPARIEERGQVLLDELDPRSTFEMLEDWEQLLGIPDECTPDGDASVSQRRSRILQKLTTGGGQNAAYYKLLASQLGYDVDDLEVVNFTDFRVGFARVGKPLSNTHTSVGVETGWPFAFQVKAPAAFVRKFRVGQSSVGERLVLPENETLECIVRKFAPAHAVVLFSFGD